MLLHSEGVALVDEGRVFALDPREAVLAVLLVGVVQDVDGGQFLAHKGAVLEEGLSDAVLGDLHECLFLGDLGPFILVRMRQCLHNILHMRPTIALHFLNLQLPVLELPVLQNLRQVKHNVVISPSRDFHQMVPLRHDILLAFYTLLRELQLLRKLLVLLVLVKQLVRHAHDVILEIFVQVVHRVLLLLSGLDNVVAHFPEILQPQIRIPQLQQRIFLRLDVLLLLIQLLRQLVLSLLKLELVLLQPLIILPNLLLDVRQVIIAVFQFLVVFRHRQDIMAQLFALVVLLV